MKGLLVGTFLALSIVTTGCSQVIKDANSYKEYEGSYIKYVKQGPKENFNLGDTYGGGRIVYISDKLIRIDILTRNVLGEISGTTGRIEVPKKEWHNFMFPDTSSPVDLRYVNDSELEIYQRNQCTIRYTKDSSGVKQVIFDSCEDEEGYIKEESDKA